MQHTVNQQQPTTTPAAANVPSLDIDCEIFNLQHKVREAQTLHEAGDILSPHIFFHTKKQGFIELQQSSFHFNLADKIHEMIVETLVHYTQQLERLQALKASSNYSYTRK